MKEQRNTGKRYGMKVIAVLMSMLLVFTSIAPVSVSAEGEQPSEPAAKIVECITAEPVNIRIEEGQTASLPTVYVHYEGNSNGETAKLADLTYTVSDEDASYIELEKDSDEVITAIKGLKKGTAKLKVSYTPDGKPYQKDGKDLDPAEITVSVVSKTLKLASDSLTMELGAQPTQINAFWEYSDGKTEQITEGLQYTVVEGKDVVEVQDGKLAAKQTGTAKVKVSIGSVSADCTVTVTRTPNALILEKNMVDVKVGDTAVIKAFYQYADESREEARDLTYTVTSNASCVELGKADGEYKAVKAGTVTITVKSTKIMNKNGQPFEARFEMMITDILAETISLNASNITNLTIGDTYQLTAALQPSNVTKPTVTYSVVNSKPLDKNIISSVVKVDAGTGLVTVTGLGEADVKVTWKSSDGDTSKNKTAMCHFYVYQESFDVTKLGADGTDMANDTTYIKRALRYATAINNPVTVYIPAGTYYLGSALYIYSDTRLVLDPGAKIVRKTTVDAPMLMSKYSGNAKSTTPGYAQCQNIEITGGVWDGNVTGKYYVNNFYIGHADNVYIHDTTVINNSGSHLIELAGVNNATIERVTLDGFKISTNRKCPVSGQSLKEAIQLDYCSKASAEKFTPHDNTACQNITIRNCSISNYMCGIGAHGFKSGVYLKNILIEGNTFTNITNCCIDMRNFQNVTIRNNTAVGFQAFVYGYRSTGFIQNNTVINQTYTPITTKYRMYANGIYMSTNSVFDITDNVISGCNNHGISIASSSTVNILRNKVTGCKKYGIKVENATARIRKNTAKNNAQARQYYADANAKIISDRIEAYYIPLNGTYTYTGKAIKPKIKIAKLSKKKYKVIYKKNKKVGTAQVIIKGKGSIKGKVTLTFQITKKTAGKKKK